MTKPTVVFKSPTLTSTVHPREREVFSYPISRMLDKSGGPACIASIDDKYELIDILNKDADAPFDLQAGVVGGAR